LEEAGMMARSVKTKIVELKGGYFKIAGVILGQVNFYSGFGWLTREELFNLRQTEPRTAP
jgi:hypothetical protein